ncbi:MAG: hypothetical protein HYT03_01175 [Candidatus Harrisonbacteria bacterium]|nr:hypothetical protein [Candidatus Harrisonbacteria bacterium]
MEIRFIKKSEWEQLRNFNADQYRPDHILTNKQYYDWQFDNVFNEQKDSYTTLGLFSKGELIGTFGMFTAPYNCFGRQVTANCLANLIIKKDLRSLGYGYRLLERASNFNDLAIDHTINQQAWPMFIKSGWVGENLKRFIYIFNLEAMRKLIINDDTRQLSASPTNPVIVRHWRWEPVEKFNENFDIFWEKVKNRYPITIKRSSQYLNWRYVDTNLMKYQIFAAVGSDGISGFAVFRTENVYRDNQAIGVKIGRLVDFVADAAAERFILGKVIEYGRQSGWDGLDYFFSGQNRIESLEDLGFFDGDSAGYASIPILFHPISTKRMHLNFAIKLINPELTKQPADKLYNWYTTKSDGDQDRPY